MNELFEIMKKAEREELKKIKVEQRPSSFPEPEVGQKIVKLCHELSEKVLEVEQLAAAYPSFYSVLNRIFFTFEDAKAFCEANEIDKKFLGPCPSRITKIHKFCSGIVNAYEKV